MSLRSHTEFSECYCAIGQRKANMSIGSLFLLSVLAGFFIGMAGATVNTAAHALTSVSLIRIVSGLLFPVGLLMVMQTGAELFTGNCLIVIPVIRGNVRLAGMFRNLAVAYVGNFLGAALLAALLAFFGQMDYSAGGLAVYTMQVAAAKCVMPFGNALVSGILCNILVCTAVMGALCAGDAAGRAVCAYVPVCAFVLCGFDQSVANMYYVPAGLFASLVPKYAALAAEAGVDLANLTWGGFLLHNLLPVTLGNIIGGVGFSAMIGYCFPKAES